jgi:hypothetical protein
VAANFLKKMSQEANWDGEEGDSAPSGGSPQAAATAQKSPADANAGAGDKAKNPTPPPATNQSGRVWPATMQMPDPVIRDAKTDGDDEPDPASIKVNLELPDDINKCRGILHGIRARRVKNKREKAQKAAEVAFVSKKIFDLQQGLPKVRMGANEFHKAHANHVEATKRQRLELMARSDMELADLLKEHADRGQSLDALSTRVTELSQENAALKAEIAALKKKP